MRPNLITGLVSMKFITREKMAGNRRWGTKHQLKSAHNLNSLQIFQELSQIFPSSTEVEYLHFHSKVKGLSTAAASGTGTGKMAKKYCI
jgi:hypothetical protein